MSDKNDTPLTDAETYVVGPFNNLRIDEGLIEVVSAIFARSLERRLAQVEAALTKQGKIVGYLFNGVFYYPDSLSDERKSLAIPLYAAPSAGEK